MKQQILFAAILVAFIGAGCNRPGSDDAGAYERAHDPWVFRSVLDSIPRILTVALNDNLWVAYSAQTGALYKAWKGGVNFDGAVYTTVHGPQPSTLGNTWFENHYDAPWTVEMNGKAAPYQVAYRGHRFEKGQVYVNYDLVLDGGKAIRINEKPEYVSNANRQTGLERTFVTSDVPAGAKLRFKTNLSSIAMEGNVQTKAPFTVSNSKSREAYGLAGIDADVELEVKANGKTTFTTYFTKKPLIENENKIVGEEETENLPRGYRLIARNDCKTCHNTYVKTIGPSYVEVAKKYDNTTANVAMLIGKVVNGGAGVWGEAAMTAHPEVEEADIKAMVEYIMTLDADEEALALKAAGPAKAMPANLKFTDGEQGLTAADLSSGSVFKIFVSKSSIRKLADVNFKAPPTFKGIMPVIYAESTDFLKLEDDFAIEASGYLEIPKDNNYVFRLSSDDGSRLIIDNKIIVNNDGEHGTDAKDGEIALSAGYHPYRVEFFQSKGGKFLSLEWRSFNDEAFEVIPTSALKHHRKDQPKATDVAPAMTLTRKIPGDGFSLDAVHPSYDLSQARPDDFAPKVGGMDFLPDGRMVISTWDAEGGVYILDNVQSGDASKITYKKIAKGLAEPLGVKVVDGDIYVMQKQELTQLIDEDGDDIIDEYRTVCNSWRVSSNFHEFGFGLAYKEGYFYAALAIAILPGGASANPQISDRGKAIRISKETGVMEIVAEGLRTPNGVGIGVDNEIFIADNQGDWLPSSKILHVSKGAFFGSRAVDSARVAQLPVKLPVVWLPQDEIGNSPCTPLALNDGPYKGQMIHGEVTHGGVKRVFVEKVGGEYQGCVFRFIQGLESGVNRMTWGPDGALYIGGIGSTGNWGHTGKLWYGLQRLKYNEKPAFEMLAVRAKSDGIEIEFTQPLAEGIGWNPADYEIRQWMYVPTRDYGGPKLDQSNLKVLSVNLSDDRKKVFLELAGMKENHVVYVHLPYEWTSANDLELWSTEAWYTLNRIPQGQPGFRKPALAPTAPNTLTAEEQKGGCKLLFDGKTTKGWRNFKKQTIGSAWKVADGAIMLDAQKKPDGGWQAVDGGDIVTDGEYENYELRLEWKIAPCGNSGVIYNVVESDKYDYVWQTGPEMQVLDNTCHPDALIEKHRAGDLYDLIACKYVTVKPAGQWNKARLVIKNGKLEHWLNGKKVVETEMFTSEWTQMIAGSKFKDMPDFGKARKGRISLQDHGDPVWYRNIKIRTF